MSILGCHPRIAVPEVTWYYPRFRPYLFTYGDLSEEAKFRVLVDEMAHGLRKPYFGMDVNVAAFTDLIFERAMIREQSFAGVFDAMLGCYADYENKPRWGEKTPYNLFYIEQILEDFPNAQIVFITRDGRDVCAEFIQASFGPTNILSAAELWEAGQGAVKPWRKRLRDDQWYDISYEALVTNPEEELEKLCTFLNEEFDSTIMEFHRTPTAQGRGRTRDNAALAHPISSQYVGRYKTELSIRDQRIMSWVAGNTLDELGYIDILDPLELDDREVAYLEEMDGRFRAASLDGPGGWIVYESYNDWLMDQREHRRLSGVWSVPPEPPVFPLGHKYEEYYTGMRAARKWKQHFSVKPVHSRNKSVL